MLSEPVPLTTPLKKVAPNVGVGGDLVVARQRDRAGEKDAVGVSSGTSPRCC